MAGRIPVGRIVAAHGIKGEVKVELLTDFLERFAPRSVLFLEDAPTRVLKSRLQGAALIVALESVTTRNQAEALRGQILEADAAKRPKLAKDEFLAADLIGFEVKTDEGEVLGSLRDILPYPAHDLLVVGDLEIPAVKEYVKDVDLAKRTITVHLIPGFRELNS